MPVDSNQIANEALLLVGGNQPPVSGQNPTWDDSTVGEALRYLYAPCVAAVARSFEWDFARVTDALVLSGNPAPLGWDFEYLYPANAVEIWQVMPDTIPDPNNPLPTTWTVANTLVSSVQTKVIHTNIEDAVAVYNNNPNENTWDADFRAAVVRLLASELAMAVAGKPDVFSAMQESSAAFGRTGMSRDG